MIRKSVILFWIEHFQQRGGGISTEVHSDLVDLVHHEDGIVGTGLPDPLDDPAGERSDIGPAVAPDLGLVADSPKRDPDKLSAERARNRFSEGSLPHPGGPTKQRMGPFIFSFIFRTARYSRIRSL